MVAAALKKFEPPNQNILTHQNKAQTKTKRALCSKKVCVVKFSQKGTFFKVTIFAINP